MTQGAHAPCQVQWNPAMEPCKAQLAAAALSLLSGHFPINNGIGNSRRTASVSEVHSQTQRYSKVKIPALTYVTLLLSLTRGASSQTFLQVSCSRLAADVPAVSRNWDFLPDCAIVVIDFLTQIYTAPSRLQVTVYLTLSIQSLNAQRLFCVSSVS